MMPIRDQEMIHINSSPEAPPPRIRILDARSREVETVRIGDRLTFRIEIPEDSKLSPLARRGKFESAQLLTVIIFQLHTVFSLEAVSPWQKTPRAHSKLSMMMGKLKDSWQKRSKFRSNFESNLFRIYRITLKKLRRETMSSHLPFFHPILDAPSTTVFSLVSHQTMATLSNPSMRLSVSPRATASSSSVTLNIVSDLVNRRCVNGDAIAWSHGAERNVRWIMRHQAMKMRWRFHKKFSFSISAMKIIATFWEVTQVLISVKVSIHSHNFLLYTFSLINNLVSCFHSLLSLDKTVTIIEPCPTKTSVLALAVTCALMVFIYLSTLFCYYTKKWMQPPKMMP